MTQFPSQKRIRSAVCFEFQGGRNMEMQLYFSTPMKHLAKSVLPSTRITNPNPSTPFTMLGVGKFLWNLQFRKT